MARTVMWLNAALALLISMAGVAHASAVYVDCDLKQDWPPYKAGDHQRFVLPDLNHTLYDTYREHCDFLYEFQVVIDGDIEPERFGFATATIPFMEKSWTTHLEFGRQSAHAARYCGTLYSPPVALSCSARSRAEIAYPRLRPR
jgi:hypothetical protein